MKQNLLKLKALLVVLMMAVGFGQAWAEDVKVYTLEPVTGSNNAYAGNCDVDCGDYTWNVNGNATYTPWRIGGKSLSGVNRTIYSKDALTDNISKVVVEHGAAANITVNSFSLTVSTAPNGGGDVIRELSGDFVANDKTTFNRPEGDDWTNCYFKFTYNVSVSGSKNKFLEFVGAEFYKDGSEPSKTPTTTTFNGESSYTVLMGEEFTSPTATVSPDGLDPIYSSSNTAVATVDATTGSVTLVGAGVTTITATYEGDETYAPSSDSYTLTVVPVYATLEALAADDNLVSGNIVNVTFQNVKIKSIYVNKSDVRQGIYFDIQKGDKDIEIYYNAEEVPETWVADGTVSGTMQCPWKNYNGTWELAPDYGTWSWGNLDYQAPAGAKTQATIDFTSKSNLEAGATDQFDVTYNGDGTLQVSSSDENVATVAIEAGHVVVNALAVGTTTITVSAPETDEYTSASKQYTLSVTQPFDRNVHKALVAEKDGKYFAAYNTIEGSNTYFAVKEVTVYNNKVYNLSDAEAAELAWLINKNSGTATVQNLNNEYLQLTTNKSTVSLSEDEVVLYTKTDGCFYVTETGRGFGYNYNQGNDRMAGYSISAQYPGAKAMEFAGENEPLPANMRISAAGWATFWAPFAVEIPAGVKAYTGEMRSGWIKLTEVPEDYIPANTGVVLQLIEGNPFDVAVSPMNPAPDAAPISSCYTGNDTGAIKTVEEGDYLLQKQNDVVGWYKVSGEGFTLAPNRCYLSKDDVPEPNQSRSFFGFAPDDATGISNIANEAKTKADGKYMVNGQIVVVKAGKAYNMNGTEVK